MSEELKDKLKKSLKNIEEGENRIFFLVQDTRGNAKASVRMIYEMAYALVGKGYKSAILQEGKEYVGVGGWLDEKYMKEIEHIDIKEGKLAVSPEDIIVVPEIFGGVMEQIAKMPCVKIVLSQAYDHIFETLQPGLSWSQLGFTKCITTTEKQREYLGNIMKNVSYEVIEPMISDRFSEKTKFPKPIIGIHSREQRDGLNIIKEFYMKFPHFRWITFRDLRGTTEAGFAKAMDETMLSVWVDPTSSFGTFPLESMKKGVPVLGLAPNMTPSWMNENNGIWVANIIDMANEIGEFVGNWLEDNINADFYKSMEETVSSLTTPDEFNSKVLAYFGGVINERKESLENNLTKLTEENSH